MKLETKRLLISQKREKEGVLFMNINSAEEGLQR